MTTPLLADLLAIVVALTTVAEPAQQVPVPFSVGERLEYDVKFGVLKVGSGRMEVVGTETVRGRQAWHTAFTVKGGTFFYKVNDRLESWIDMENFASLRHVQDLREGRRDRERRYEIFPDRMVYTENEGPEQPTARDPLDDGSFLYFIRTVPLSVGQTYDFPRYFKPDRNPVRVRVLRKESVKVPAGRFDAIVIQPIIKSKGIFSENGRAEIWLSDDDRRIMLQMKSNLSFGTLNLYLKSYTEGTATAAK
ncbi:MAG TPA: DUF3108 domain-containing protein [Gemmatimonadaceae bacterium]|nr:DUF3108 domain-containing protein [Gemmatimonadaceae bacterium]